MKVNYRELNDRGTDRSFGGHVPVPPEKRFLITFRVCLSVVCACLGSVAFAANEIGFIEKFSLAEDRTEALEQLIPGTDDYYYYHCLHYQNTGSQARYDEFLKLYIKRHGYTRRVNELRYRQALLDYEKKSQDLPEVHPQGTRTALRSPA